MKNTNRFPITYWCGVPYKYLYTSDGQIDRTRFEEMKEAGMNLVISSYAPEANQKVLDICQELDLDVIIHDYRIWEAIKHPDKRRELLFDVANDYKNHPAMHSYHIVDEPGASDFPMLADVRAILHEADPIHESYINLFPNYASPQQLGNPTYYDHIEDYLSTVKPEILSYDHYHFLTKSPIARPNYTGDEREKLIIEAACNKVERAGFFDNFEIVRELCLKHKTPYMIIILLVAHGPYRYLNESEIRWEVFQSLAYGSRRLSYFTYWTPGDGGSDNDDFWKWNNGMISQQGERTEHYYMVKDINVELSAMGDVLMDKQSIGVFHTVNAPETRTKLFEGFESVSRIEGDDMTVGFFEDGYAVFANKSYENEAEAVIYTDSIIEIFDAIDREWIALENADGKYTVSLDAGDGMLVRFVKE
ncbi:MAG: hypothetical protein IJY39_07720 [Clostridia bacterium]|nr:hypothetical protein [Clostridia bacterium]